MWEPAAHCCYKFLNPKCLIAHILDYAWAFANREAIAGVVKYDDCTLREVICVFQSCKPAAGHRDAGGLQILAGSGKFAVDCHVAILKSSWVTIVA